MNPTTGNSEINNPVTGERIVFLKTASETAGEVLALDFFIKPGGGVFVPHLHMRQTETMTLVRGELLVTVNGEPRRVQQGETLSLSPRSGHTLRNETQREVHAYVEFRPALRSEEFLRTIFGLAERGETDDKGDVSFLQAAAMMPRYEMYRADVPLLLQRILFAILGPIARLIGYQSTLER